MIGIEMDLTPFKNCFAHKNAIYISTAEKSYAPCCFHKEPINAISYDDYRDKISKVDIAKACKYCIDMEQSGATWSHRLQYDQSYYQAHGKLFVVGVCFDNICNIKCTTCGPTSSSKWIEDYAKLNPNLDSSAKKRFVRIMNQAPDKIKFVRDLLDKEEFDSVRFDIFGGEPSINPTVIEFMDWLCEQPYAKNVMINLTTNTTTYFDKIEYYCSKFKFIQMQMSIDGQEEYFDHLRFGANWQVVKENIMRYDKLGGELSNLWPSIHLTLSWMNCLHVADFYEWVYKNTVNLVGFNMTKLTYPPYYSIDNIKPEVRENIKTEVMSRMSACDLTVLDPNKAFNFNHFKEVYETSMSNYINDYYKTNLLQDGFDVLTRLDTIRNTDYKKTFSPILTLMEK